MTDILMNALEHSWGTSPTQKKREKEYNAEYYRKNKEKWKDDPKQINVPSVNDHWLMYKPKITRKPLPPGMYPKTEKEEREWYNKGWRYIDGKWYGVERDTSTDPGDLSQEMIKENQREMRLAQLSYAAAKKHNISRISQGAAMNEASKVAEAERKSQLAAENERARLAEAERKARLAAKKAYYLSEIKKEQAKQNKSTGKKIREFIDGTVEIAMDKAAKNISEGINFLSDFFGISSSSNESKSTVTTGPSSRPRSRQKNVTNNGTGVQRRGRSGQGKVGNR